MMGVDLKDYKDLFKNLKIKLCKTKKEFIANVKIARKNFISQEKNKNFTPAN